MVSWGDGINIGGDGRNSRLQKKRGWASLLFRGCLHLHVHASRTRERMLDSPLSADEHDRVCRGQIQIFYFEMIFDVVDIVGEKAIPEARSTLKARYRLRSIKLTLRVHKVNIHSLLFHEFLHDT